MMGLDDVTSEKGKGMILIRQVVLLRLAAQSLAHQRTLRDV